MERKYLRSAQVAHLFSVDPRTVARWGAEGRLSSIRTAGGHRRFLPEEVEALIRSRFMGSPTIGYKIAQMREMLGGEKTDAQS